MSNATSAALLAFNMANVEVVGTGATQATATRLTHALSIVNKSVGSGSFILPSIASGEASEAMILVNQTGAAVLVFPYTGEKTNNSVNGSVSVAGGAVFIGLPVLNSVGVYPTPLDWRTAVIT